MRYSMLDTKNDILYQEMLEEAANKKTNLAITCMSINQIPCFLWLLQWHEYVGTDGLVVILSSKENE